MFFIGVNTVLLASEYHDDEMCDAIWAQQGYLGGTQHPPRPALLPSALVRAPLCASDRS